MRISSKGRYALAVMITLAQNASQETPLTVIAISGRLNISKIYLEQVFSMLRKGGLVTSSKGKQGGYQLSRSAEEITAADILSVTELSFFEEPEVTVADAAPGIERALRDTLYKPANAALKEVFGRMPLSTLAEESLRRSALDAYMYCI